MLNSEYAQQCVIAIKEFISNSTHNGFGDLQVLNFTERDYGFLISEFHSLETLAESEEFIGLVIPEEGDLTTSDWAFHQELTQRQVFAEQLRGETLGTLVDAIPKHDFATIQSRTFIRAHPTRHFHAYKCRTCSGAGQEPCCVCSGRGWTPCNGCNGSGRVSRLRQVRTHSGHTKSEWRNETCAGCLGSGRATCRPCFGEGLVACIPCDGHGDMTVITSTNTYTTPLFKSVFSNELPDYVSSAVSKIGYSKLANYCSVDLEFSQKDVENNEALFEYSCSMHFCELTVKYSNHISKWVLYGFTPNILRSDNALEPFLKDDANSLTSACSCWLLLRPWFFVAAHKALNSFMQSRIHREVLAAHNGGLSTELIANKIGYSLSANYIGHSLRSLRRVILALGIWSKIFIATVTIILGIAFALFMVYLISHGQHLYFAKEQARQTLFPWSTHGGIYLFSTLFSIPVALIGLIASRWFLRRLIKRAGGDALLIFANNNHFFTGKAFAFFTAVITSISIANFYSKWPMWVDRNGLLYGLIQFTPPSEISDGPVTKRQPAGYNQPNRQKSKIPIPSPDAQPKTPAVLHQPNLPGITSQPNNAEIRYYCEASRLFYPQVSECPAGWVTPSTKP